MPLYEYSCGGCGGQVEILVRGEDKPVCPECGSRRLTKLVSVVAGHVKQAAADPGQGGCGRPQCGSGGCAGLGPT